MRPLILAIFCVAINAKAWGACKAPQLSTSSMQCTASGKSCTAGCFCPETNCEIRMANGKPVTGDVELAGRCDSKLQCQPTGGATCSSKYKCVPRGKTGEDPSDPGTDPGTPDPTVGDPNPLLP